MGLQKKDFIFQDVNKLKGVGKQFTKYLKKKKIEKIKDIIFNLPYSETDRSKISKINEIEIGKIHSLKLMVKNYLEMILRICYWLKNFLQIKIISTQYL